MAIPSNFTHFGGNIPDGSEATPGLWDRRFSNISQNLDQLNSDVSTRQEVFNVKAFGAVGDGSTDDTSAIRSAFDAAPDSGARVFFPPGTYVVSSTLSIPTVSGDNLVPLVIEGAGESTPAGVLEGFAEGVSAISFTGSGALFDLRQGNGSTTADFQGVIRGLSLHGAGSGSLAIDAADVRTAVFKDMQIRSFETGCRFVGQIFYSHIENLTFADISDTGFRTEGSINGTKLRRCRFSDSTTRGFDLSSGGVQASFDGCWFENNGNQGLRVDETISVSLRDCYFEDNGGSQIRFQENSGNPSRLEVVGCYFRPPQNQDCIKLPNNPQRTQVVAVGCVVNSDQTPGDFVFSAINQPNSVAAYGNRRIDSNSVNLLNTDPSSLSAVVAFDDDLAFDDVGSRNLLTGDGLEFSDSTIENPAGTIRASDYSLFITSGNTTFFINADGTV